MCTDGLAIGCHATRNAFAFWLCGGVINTIFLFFIIIDGLLVMDLSKTIKKYLLSLVVCSFFKSYVQMLLFMLLL